MKKEIRKLSHGELVQMSVAAQNGIAIKPEPVSSRRISHGELVQMSVAAQNSTQADVNSTKYLNQMPLEELFEFFVPFGIDGEYQIQQNRNENGKIQSLRFFCDDFNATLSSDFKFAFDFFDHYAGDRNSLGKTIKYYEIAQLSEMLNLTRNQTMSLLLTGLFINKFPEYEKEWKQLFESGQIPAFKPGSVPKSFNGFENLKTLFELTKVIKQSQAEDIGKQLV